MSKSQFDDGLKSVELSGLVFGDGEGGFYLPLNKNSSKKAQVWYS